MTSGKRGVYIYPCALLRSAIIYGIPTPQLLFVPSPCRVYGVQRQYLGLHGGIPRPAAERELVRACNVTRTYLRRRE